MKKMKKLLAIVIVTMMLAVSFSNIAFAAFPSGEGQDKIETEYDHAMEELIDNKKLASYNDFISAYLLKHYVNHLALKLLDRDLVTRRENIKPEDDGIIPIHAFDGDNSGLDGLADGTIDASDAQTILQITLDAIRPHEASTELYDEFTAKLKKDVADFLDVDSSEIKTDLIVKVNDSVLEKYGIEDYKVFGGETNTVIVTDDTTIEQREAYYDDATYLGAKIFDVSKEELDDMLANMTEDEAGYLLGKLYYVISHLLTIRVENTVTVDGEERVYRMTLVAVPVEDETVDDLALYFCWVPQDIVDDDEFGVNIKYFSTVPKTEVEWKQENGTFYPPYYDNDIDKKDSDVVVKIRSKIQEKIVAVNGVAMNEDGTPNSEGWYYPDKRDKYTIAKSYPFDTYNTTEFNGIVKESLTITGENDGEAKQDISIQWTFRRRSLNQTENEDESTTVTISFNLPIDKESIPEGWNPIYDADGETIHAITMLVPKGKGYDKDVVVKQNGTEATVSTKVTIAPTVIPQAGESFIFAVIVLGILVFAITRFRKIDKNIK